jgi:Tfp pilus assembly protein PilN
VIRINLAPPTERPRRSARRLGIAIGLAAVILLAVIFGWARALAQEEKRLAESVAGRARELTTLRELLGNANRLRDDFADLTKRIHTIQALMLRRGTTLHILDALLDSIPHDLWITTLEGRGRELRALGAAWSAAAVTDLMSSLRASGRFVDVDIVVARQELGEVLDVPLLFEITCRFGG